MTKPSLGSPLLIHGKDVRSGDVVTVARNGVDWKYIDFRVTRLRAGSRLAGATANDEVALIVIEGTIAVTSSAGSWETVGGRASPFSGPPSAVYLPADTSYELHARGAAEVAICAAPSKGALPARLLTPAPDAEYIRGKGHAERRIRNILMGEDEATSLFLTEVVTLPGNWSSYPPHKHDEARSGEAVLEEIYYFETATTVVDGARQMGRGFAMQRLYTSDGQIDLCEEVHQGDVVLIPRGYHGPSMTAPGYDLYYLNVLAGPAEDRTMAFCDDPDHHWVRQTWQDQEPDRRLPLATASGPT